MPASPFHFLCKLITFTAGMCIPLFAAEPPLLLPHENYNNVVRLPDGTIYRLDIRNVASQGGLGIYYSFSTDNGLTWTGGTNTAEWKLAPAISTWNPIPAVDLDGNLHLFQLSTLTEGRYDLYHYQVGSENGWELVQTANSGSVMKAITTSSGTILVPYGSRIPSPPPGHGNFLIVVNYREAESSKWELSPNQLISPVPSDWNGANDGACEPTVIELEEGVLWMLARSQTGKLTESYSYDDGKTWTPLKDSNFYTTTGPPNLVRLDDGGLVLLWNNGTMPQRHEGKVWYAGRDVIHAAVSYDNGQTWSGFREIYADPSRNENPPAGDVSTAYSFATATDDNHVLAILGQSTARTMIRLDPQWLLVKNHRDDFTRENPNENPLDDWHVFKPWGNVGDNINIDDPTPEEIPDPAPVKRNRVQGPQLSYSDELQKNVLHIRRPEAYNISGVLHDPDGATWNFPMATRARTTISFQLQEGFKGGSFGLTDRFFNPTDVQGDQQSFFLLDIPSNGLLPDGTKLSPGRWYEITLDWNVSKNKAILWLDGKIIGTIQSQDGVEVWPGLSYLRLRSTSPEVDEAGYLVNFVDHNATNIRDSERMTSEEAQDALDGNDNKWTRIRFDDYVPNTNVSPANLNGNGTIRTFQGDFQGFVSPLVDADPVGILIETSKNSLTFSDGTSAQITSDIIGPQNGETLTIRFVDIIDTSIPATVSAVAFRLGSLVPDNVSIHLFDLEGNELYDWEFSTMPGGLSLSIGYYGFEDLVETSLIHAIEFRALESDTWMIGSFNQDPNLIDFAFRNYTVHWDAIPEPVTLCVLLTAFVIFCLHYLCRNRRSLL